jgi:serine/threonine protein kinase
MAVVAGQKIGPYEVSGQIGAGGMGEVYRVRDRRLRRDVAVKVLPASFSSDSDRLQRFAQEARAAAALNHPNILAIFDIGEDKTAPYVVSELLEGETLRDRLRSGALSTRRVLITEDVGQAGIVSPFRRVKTVRRTSPGSIGPSLLTFPRMAGM